MNDEQAVDVSQSLQQLEDDDWGEPTYPSRLVIECHRLRRVPLRDLTAGNWRMLLGQRIGTRYLVPMALAYLSTDPLADIGRYPGALLEVVLRQPHAFWHEQPALHLRSVAVAERALPQMHRESVDAGDSVLRDIRERIEGFLADAADAP